MVHEYTKRLCYLSFISLKMATYVAETFMRLLYIKKCFTSVNFVRIVTLYTLNARIMDDVNLTDFHVCDKGLASPTWGLNLLHHCGSLSTET